MRFGVREICDVVFKPLSSVDIGNYHFDAGQPVLYLDTAKTSSLEGASTTVYAQGGKGNPRLIGWDGEKTLTFTVEDALMSDMSFAMLSGAGVIKGTGKVTDKDAKKIYVHTTYDLVVEKDGEKYIAKLTDEERDGATLVVTKEAPVYPVLLDAAGGMAAYLSAVSESQVLVDGTPATIGDNGVVEGTENKTITFVLASDEGGDTRLDQDIEVGQAVRIDCYTVHTEGATELQIDAATFAGYYYIEASTLFRSEVDGTDMPAEFVIPRGKIQSNFTFSMANSGDPSTFTFTIDAFPAYTKFNKNKKVMAALQIIDAEGEGHNYRNQDILGHENRTGDEDVDKWYTKSVFEGDASFSDPQPEPEEPEEPETNVSITASIPTGVTVGNYHADQGFTGAVAQQGDNFVVTGDFTKQEEANDDLKLDPSEAKGYYLPIQFEGEKGQAIKLLTGTQKTEVFGETGDTDTTMVLVLAIDPDSPSLDFAEYASESDATSNIDPKPFTIDCSGCSFN